jgi:hypothetical protein
MSSSPALTLELACGRTLLVDCHSPSDSPLHRHNAMTEYGEIYPWLVVARRFGVGSSVSDEPLFYLVRCVSEGWVEVSPETAERQLYGVGIPNL